MEKLARLDLGVDPDSFVLDLSQEVEDRSVVDCIEVRWCFDANGLVPEFVDD